MVGSKKQNILLLTVICCATLALISITWAAFSSTLKLSGQASVAAQSWDIDFTNTVGTKWTTAQTLTGTKTNLAELPTSSSGAFGLPVDQTASGFLGSLRMSGDKITYTWYVQNFGTFEAKYSISGLISTSKYLSGSNVDITCNTSDNNSDKTFCNNYVKTTLTIDGVVADASSSYTLAKAGQTGDSSTLVLTIEIIGDNQIYTATAGAFENKYYNVNPSMLLGGIEMLDSSSDLNISVTGLTLSGTQSVAEITTTTTSATTVSYESHKNENWSFSTTESSQEFKVPYPGNYKIELWGAAGGSSTWAGGNGAYTSGIINLNQNTELYIYVGGKGQLSTTISGDKTGWNGGGTSYYSPGYGGSGASGGGATDVRLVSGEWNDFDSLKSRIMVAAGGGGGTYSVDKSGQALGGAAGGVTGYSGTRDTRLSYGNVASGGIQTSGGTKSGCGTNFCSANTNGGFGYGGVAGPVPTSAWWPGGGGGSGYFGGGGGASGYIFGGAGGSSYISGHDGCIAISESSTSTNIISTSSSIHYSGKSFSSTTMIDGNGYSWTTSVGSQTGMPSFDGNSTMTGNTGNGYAKITYLGE